MGDIEVPSGRREAVEAARERALRRGKFDRYRVEARAMNLTGRRAQRHLQRQGALAKRRETRKAASGLGRTETKSMLDQALGGGETSPGELYVTGEGALNVRDSIRLPAEACGEDWHRAEAWGIWAARRDARVRLRTSLPPGAKVLLALKLQAPPGGRAPGCSVRIGSTESRVMALAPFGQWRLFEGEVGPSGLLLALLRAHGVFGRPDPRELFVGLQSLGFAAMDDGEARERLMRKVRNASDPFAKRAASTVLTALRRTGLRVSRPLAVETTFKLAERPQPSAPMPQAAGGSLEQLRIADVAHELAPELVARPLADFYEHRAESIEIRQLGRDERTPWGKLRTLRGVECVRGYCLSRTPVLELQIAVNGYLLHRGPLRGGYEMAYELDTDMRKYVFNVWFDVSSLPFGRYEMDLRFVDANDVVRTTRWQVAIAPPLPLEDFASSDRVVTIPEGKGSIEEKINQAPSSVRPAQRTYFETPVRNVLAMRVDQLGDMVCSVPALRRLRAVFPHARLIGLISAANEGLARSLDLFDEYLPVDFPDDEAQRRRVMPIERQLELKQKLSAYKFDVAIDLSESGVSRPLLRLAEARYMIGFQPEEFKWLSSAFGVQTHDPVNALESVPHATKLIGLMEWIDALTASQMKIEPNPHLRREALSVFGLSETDRFAVLHTGARLRFSRWPHYAQLAQTILERTDLKIVMMADDPDYGDALPASLKQSDRFQLLARRLQFDEFDALLSFCSGFVGNDSGPKHLASLRGAPVVSIHCARNNWNEWGQENRGYVLSRRVPCAGCSIHHYSEECGKDHACVTQIRPEEVFAALEKAMAEAG